MCDVMGPLSYPPPGARARPYPPTPPSKSYPPPCESEVQGGYSELINYGTVSKSESRLHTVSRDDFEHV